MMRGQALIDKLGDRLAGLRGRITPNAEMDKITWFRAGGLAEALFQPADEEDLAVFLRAVPEDIPLTIVGVGSNLLVRDGGIHGFVVRLSAKGFGAWFRKRCDEAELYHCSAHGLRKANARRAAEIGLSNQSIKSVTGHSTDSEVSRYTAKAEQAAMARDAIDKMAAWYLSNPEERLDK